MESQKFYEDLEEIYAASVSREIISSDSKSTTIGDEPLTEAQRQLEQYKALRQAERDGSEVPCSDTVKRRNTNWMLSGSCKNRKELFFPAKIMTADGSERSENKNEAAIRMNKARRLCKEECPVYDDCFSYALALGSLIKGEIMAGMNDRELDVIRANRGDTSSKS